MIVAYNVYSSVKIYLFQLVHYQSKTRHSTFINNFLKMLIPSYTCRFRYSEDVLKYQRQIRRHTQTDRDRRDRTYYHEAFKDVIG